MKNPEIVSGNVELKATELEIISQAETPPFEVDDTKDVNEEVRMKYRYIDLRSERMQTNLTVRSKIIHEMRQWLHERDFVEIETPNLTKSTPEGARDYIVPSRLQPGKFYALPQSPQQYKQLLMISGVERYFQIARCFRDEDTRGDRQPEFTQLDLEMAFVEREDIIELIEELYIVTIGKLFPNKKISIVPFPRLTYKEAMARHQSDRPDLRLDKSNANELAFVWIIDFPLFEKDPQTNRWTYAHNPFSAPQQKFIDSFEKKPEEALSEQYDLVLNSFEVAGGSIRNTDPNIQQKIFEFLGHKPDQILDKFGHLLNAYRYGAPNHGGIALGLDRFCAIIQNEPNIREAIAFPKTGDGRDLLMNAPSDIDESQLHELHLAIDQKDHEI
jgi:aspartyl-tRNA synthetase